MATEPKPQAQALDEAQAALNRAVATWARGRAHGARHTPDHDAAVLTEFENFQMAAGLAFNEAAKAKPEQAYDDNLRPIRTPTKPGTPYFTAVPVAPAGWEINTTTAALPRYDAATEARIANLLAVVSYPSPISGGDAVRKRALDRALQMLGLNDGELT